MRKLMSISLSRQWRGSFFSLSGWRVAPLVLDVTNQERHVQWRQVYLTCHQICAKNSVPVRLGNPDPGTLDLQASPRLNRMEVDFHEFITTVNSGDSHRGQPATLP